MSVIMCFSCDRDVDTDLHPSVHVEKTGNDFCEGCAEMGVIDLYNSGKITEDEAVQQLMDMEFDLFEALDFVENRGNV